MKKRLFLFMACLAVSNFANAALVVNDVPNTPHYSFRFGLMPTVSVFQVKDPDGPTALGNALSLLSGVMFADAGREGRIMANVIYDKFSIGASTTNIAQDITRISASVSYQTLLKGLGEMTPWAGVGVGNTAEEGGTRYKLTPGGFAIPYPGRSVDNFFLLMNTSAEWKFNREWTTGVHLQYEQPIGVGSKVFRAGVYVAF